MCTSIGFSSQSRGIGWILPRSSFADAAASSPYSVRGARDGSTDDWVPPNPATVTRSGGRPRRLLGPLRGFGASASAWGGDFIGDVEWSSFGDVADPGVFSRIHDEGVQVLENIANIRDPVIAAVEGRAHIHSDYALLASVIVAAEDATFQDVGHFAVGVTPGDGIFTTWSYRAGAGRAEAFLLNPQPLSACAAYEWGVVAEVVPSGKALARARELADLYLRAPEVTRRNTRIHFIQPLKERIVREVGYGLSLEGASSADMVKSKKSKR
jgi:enoyl-CoA hydratase/carnithine racemase